MAKLINCDWKKFDQVWPLGSAGSYVVTMNINGVVQIFELGDEVNGKTGLFIPNTGLCENEFLETDEFDLVYWDYFNYENCD